MKIPITKPYFDETEKQLIVGPIETGWVVQGPYVAKFEQKIAEYTHIPYALATTSCTTALHLVLSAWGLGPGDEVLVPAFTFVATANAVEYVRARPIFVDIDLNTFNIAVEQIESKITAQTKAIIPVSLFGLSADMNPILDIARRHSLKVLEDAACAMGAWYHGYHAGALADAGALSFHPRKAITTGEGGMVLTHDAILAEQVRSLRDHGATVSDLQRHQSKRSFLMPEYNKVGYNYRMTDIQGALGVAQAQKLEYILERRRALAKIYDAALADLDWLVTPQTPKGYIHGYQSYVCLFRPDNPTMANVERLHELRNSLMARLEDAGISTRQGTQAVHTLGYYRQKYHLKAEDFPMAYIADRLTLTLPLYVQMTESEQEYVITQLRKGF